MPGILGPIQKDGDLLLRVLGIKSMGRSPAELSDQVVGVIDAQQLYTQQNVEAVRDSLTPITGPGGTTLITVPANEWWYVSKFSAACTGYAAGNLAQGKAYVEISGANVSNVSQQFGPTSSLVAPAGVTSHLSFESMHDFWCGPGSRFGVWLDYQVSAANPGLTLNVLLTRFLKV